MRRAAGITGFLAFWLLMVFAVALSVYLIAGDGRLLAREMERFAPPETTGLPAEEYPGVGRMISDYLTGKIPDFQYTFTDGKGTVFLCFRDYEAAHMRDCRGLIGLARTLIPAAGVAFLLLGMMGFLLRRHGRAADGLLLGLITAAAAGTGVLLWAALDFDGLFTAFHRLAFTNDGWLLDPRTDLLIRLMPTPFFISLGVRVLLAACGTAAAVGLAVVWIRGWQKRKEQNSHEV